MKDSESLAPDEMRGRRIASLEFHVEKLGGALTSMEERFSKLEALVRVLLSAGVQRRSAC